MSNHKTHKLTSLLLAIALLIAPFATLQAAVLSVVDCPDKTMTMTHEGMNHAAMGHGNMTNTDMTDDSATNEVQGSTSVAGDRMSGATTPCTSMDSGCHVSAYFGAVVTSNESSSPEMLSSFEPTPNQSFSVVTLPTEIKPPISL